MNSDVIRLNEKFVNGFWQLRMELLQELMELPNSVECSLLELATKQYYLSHINQDLFCWGALQENTLAAIGALCLFSRIPYDGNLTGSEGYILSIYTVPAYRKQGCASKILDAIIDYAKTNGVRRLWLSSSVQGRRLYVKRGFTLKEHEMELLL